MPEQLHTIEDVARILQISVSSVRLMIKENKLETLRIGRQIRISESALNDFIARQASKQ